MIQTSSYKYSILFNVSHLTIVFVNPMLPLPGDEIFELLISYKRVYVHGAQAVEFESSFSRNH